MQQTRQNLTQSSTDYHQTYMDIPLQPGQWRCMSYIEYVVCWNDSWGKS